MPKNKRKSIIGALKNATSLSTPKAKMQDMPSNVLDFFRALIDPSNDDSVISGISNPYQHAKERMNRLWNPKPLDPNANPVAKLTTFRGLLSSYFTSEKRMQAWGNTGGLATVSTLSGINVALMINQYAVMMSEFADSQFSPTFFTELSKWIGLIAGQGLILSNANKRLSDKLSLGMTTHLRDKFGKTFEEHPDLLQKASQAFEKAQKGKGAADDENQTTLEHAMLDAQANFAGSFIYRSNEYLSITVATCATLATLFHNSVPIEQLNSLAENLNNAFPNNHIDYKSLGTLVTALGIAIPYSWGSKHFGAKLGEIVETKQEKHDAVLSQTRRSLSHAQKTGESDTANTELDGYKERIKDIHTARDEFQKAQFFHHGYMQFVRVGNAVISFIPSTLSTGILNGGITGALNGNIINNILESSTQSFWATQGATLLFMEKLSNLVHLMSSKGDLTVPQRQMNMAAEAIEEVWQAKLSNELKTQEKIPAEPQKKGKSGDSPTPPVLP